MVAARLYMDDTRLVSSCEENVGNLAIWQDIEKVGPKLGVISQSVKDVVQVCGSASDFIRIGSSTANCPYDSIQDLYSKSAGSR